MCLPAQVNVMLFTAVIFFLLPKITVLSADALQPILQLKAILQLRLALCELMSIKSSTSCLQRKPQGAGGSSHYYYLAAIIIYTLS